MSDFYIGATCNHTVNGTIYTISNCPLCYGLGYRWIVRENDIQIDASRKPFMIEGVNKLKQGVMKILLTKKGSDPIDLDYGSNLYQLVGKKTTLHFHTLVKSEILNALAYYNVINVDNTNLDEVIDTIKTLSIERDTTDPRKIVIDMTLLTKSGKEVPLNAAVGD